MLINLRKVKKYRYLCGILLQWHHMTSQQSYTIIKQLYIYIVNHNGLSP